MASKYDSLTLMELYKIFTEYKDMEGFVQRHPHMDYVSFDYYTVEDLNLFTLQPDFNFDLVEQTADKIIKNLPAIKRIFSKPVLHLKETSEILPVESVRLINNSTMQHIANHSELWDNIKDKAIQPLKLLTNTYQDNYSIYENIVFCNTIDSIMIFVRSSIRFLKDLIYANQAIQFNLLERVNHVNYFLALGKLHTGYIRNFDKYYFVSKRCLEKLNYIYDIITPRLKSPIYKKNKVRPTKINVHKTNILSMHKDYHKIYMLAKSFSVSKLNTTPEISKDEIKSLKYNYYLFCQIILFFAIGHFNFVCDPKMDINFSELKAKFQFKDWELRIDSLKRENIDIISIEIKKDMQYRIFLIPSIDRKNKPLVKKIKEISFANEYIVCTPYEEEESLIETCYLSISSVESFRRIQQILLRGMIYSDNKREDCPFCNNGLTKSPQSSKKNTVKYECFNCRTQIIDTVCTNLPIPYSYTSIMDLKCKNLRKEKYSKEDIWLYHRKLERQMYYRNITKINDEMKIICPRCHKVHD